VKFEKGKSGNPNGRKAGQPNRLTMAVRERVAAGSDPIAFLQKVMDGGPIPEPHGDAHEAGELIPTIEQRIRAAVTLSNKLAPDAKDQPLRFKLGPINNLADALAASAKVAEAMGEGELTPSEANAVMAVLGTYAKTYEATELERRIAELEGRAR
jgi:hypothetical protein